ncbi:MAG: ankyrin repeat domain-containing protein, partial [Alphaproteobacteria bacterium]|nr:ankyrin repeat domain-containing protein [Alphaproteobacteria bacterium]
MPMLSPAAQNAPPVTPSDFLSDALWKGQEDEAKRLAAALPVEELNKPDRFGCLPLSMTVLKNSMDVMRLLLERGVDPEARDRRGETPVEVAVKRYHGEAQALFAAAI